MVLQASRYCQLELGDYIRLARRSAAVRQSDAMYALDAKAAIFRRAWRLLPALAAILIPASVLSKKSPMLSRSASERISLCFFALVSFAEQKARRAVIGGAARRARTTSLRSQNLSEFSRVGLHPHLKRLHRWIQPPALCDFHVSARQVNT